jgi:hypothetical protein
VVWAVSSPPTQVEVQSIADKLDELINNFIEQALS